MTGEFQNRQRGVKFAIRIFLGLLALLLGAFLVIWVIRNRDAGGILLGVLSSLLAVIFGVWMIKGAGVNVRRVRRTRYFLAEFLLLVLLTGLGMGLTAKALPEKFGHVGATVVALGVGVLLIAGGLLGLWIANQLGVESSRRRMLLLLRGFLAVPAVPGFFAGILALERSTSLSPSVRLLAAVGVLLGMAAGLLHLLAGRKLFLRARAAERRKAEEAAQAAASEKPAEEPPEREAEKTAGPPADSPPESADREA